MAISKIKKDYITKAGFTLVELVVVLGGLSALTAVTVPGILNQIKLSKIESTKALMNGYAADCLGKYRTSENPSETFVNKVEPEFDIVQLENLGYKLDGTNKTCTSFGIKSINENETFAYGMKFEVSGGKVTKIGSPKGSPPPEGALRSCKNWAGQNCGMTPEQEKKLAEERAKQKKKDECDKNYYDWRQKAYLANSNLQGTGRSWNSKDEKCNVTWWAYGGKIGPNKDWYDQEVQDAIGEKCYQWTVDRRSKSKLTDEELFPKGETDTNCQGKYYWFTLDKTFTEKSEWESQVLIDAKNICEKDIMNYQKEKFTGDKNIKPSIGPLPCGTTKWFCDGIVEPDQAAWEAGKCGQEKKKREEAAEEARRKAEEAKKVPGKRLPPEDVPIEVPGKIPGRKIKCKTPMPSLCNSPKWRKIIPDCKCWYPNG